MAKQYTFGSPTGNPGFNIPTPAAPTAPVTPPAATPTPSPGIPNNPNNFQSIVTTIQNIASGLGNLYMNLLVSLNGTM